MKLLIISALWMPFLFALNAKSAILIDADTGQILFEQNAHEKMYPASISKVATALVVLEEKGDLAEVAIASREAVCAISTEEKRKKGFTSPSHWIEHGSSHIGIKVGEELSLEALLYGLMLQSANDAANVLAEHLSGTVPAFMEKVNARVEEIGCENTYLTNPHGLHHPEHLSSAYDIALITQKAIAYPKFREVVSARSFERPTTNLQEAVQLGQKNRLVRPGRHYYPKAIGVKTGFTQHSKGTLVAAAEDGERTLIAVVMGCYPFSETYRDVTELFEKGFSMEKVVAMEAQSFSRRVPGAKGRLRASMSEDLYVYGSNYETEVVWYDLPLPIKKGAVVGAVQAVAGSVPLVADETVSSSFFLWITLWPWPFKLAFVGAFGYLFVKRIKLRK